MRKVIVIGCDNAAVALKRELIAQLVNLEFEYEDVGVNSTEDKENYPAIAERLCKSIISSGYEKLGILCCGTGLGMAMTANKFPGIFAGVCHDVYSAERSKLSNNANVICFGARVIGAELAKVILSKWLQSDYVSGCSSQSKVDLMRKIDFENIAKEV